MASNPSSSSSSSPLPLAGRTAIVTGASRGLGRAIAAHLSSLGADIIIGYSASASHAEALALELTTSRGVPVKADVSDPASVKSMFDIAESAFGRPVHILVANAGVLDPKYPTIADTPVDDWDKTFAVNARGAFLCCREAANRLVRGGSGRIIAITSSAAAIFSPRFGAYAASKAAVEAMIKIMAKELKGTLIAANCVSPGPVATDMFFDGKTEEDVKKAVEINPMGRLGEINDIAPVVGFLCTDAAGWVNGQVIRVNGGYV